MSEQGNIFITGIIIAVISYFAKNFILQPLFEFRKVKGKIHNRLKYHSNIITNGEFPLTITKPIREELRQLSCDIEEAYYSIPFARYFPTFFVIPTEHDLNLIANNLIFLSNSVGYDNNVEKNYEMVNSVREKLGIIIYD